MAARMHSNTITPFLKKVSTLRKIASHTVLPSIFELEGNFQIAESRTYKSKIPNEAFVGVKSHELKDTRGPNDYDQSKEKEATTYHEEALVDKLHPNDRPMSKAVPIRSETEGLEDILARWNVNKPKK